MEWKHVVKDGKENPNKWELKVDGVVLGTIYHKPTGEYSVYISSPIIYKKVYAMAGQTYTFESFESAKQGFIDLVTQYALKWCEGIVKYIKSI